MYSSSSVGYPMVGQNSAIFHHLCDFSEILLGIFLIFIVLEVLLGTYWDPTYGLPHAPAQLGPGTIMTHQDKKLSRPMLKKIC